MVHPTQACSHALTHTQVPQIRENMKYDLLIQLELKSLIFLKDTLCMFEISHTKSKTKCKRSQNICLNVHRMEKKKILHMK